MKSLTQLHLNILRAAIKYNARVQLLAVQLAIKTFLKGAFIQCIAEITSDTSITAGYTVSNHKPR